MHSASNKWERIVDAPLLSHKDAKSIWRASLLICIIFYIIYFKLGISYLSHCGSVGGSFGLLGLPIEALIFTVLLFIFIWMIGYVAYCFKRGASKLNLAFILTTLLIGYCSWHILGVSYDIVKTYNLNQKISVLIKADKIQESFIAFEKNPSSRYAKYTVATIVGNPHTGTQTLNAITNNKKMHHSFDCEMNNLLIPKGNRCLPVTRIIAGHPNVSPAILAKLSTELTNNYYLACDISTNPNTPPEILEKLINQADIDPRILYKVAKNPSLPNSALFKLSKHEDKKVSQAAQEQLCYRKFKSKK
jgi:hypothetical protein